MWRRVLESHGGTFFFQLGFLDILGLRRLRCLVCPANFAIGVRDVRGVFVFGVWGAEFFGVVDGLGLR